MPNITCEIPVRTISELNCSEHWAVKSRRHKRQKQIVNLALNNRLSEVTLPCHIKITRYSMGTLDFDNMCASQKWVVDAICEMLIPGLAPGRADGDKRITVSYEQEKKNKKGIRVEIISKI